MRSDLMAFLSPLRPALIPLALAALMALLPMAPALAQQPSAEDLRALVYYLDHNDQRSVQAELRRLRAQFPHWTPPGDLGQLRAITQTSEASVDERPMWEMIEREDYAGARAMIAQAQAATPTYVPNPELTSIIDTNESQEEFETAFVRNDVQGAMTAMRRSPTLMRCDRINNAWRLAELYSAAGQTESAVGTYRSVVQSCRRPGDVIPTLEKANDVASWEQMLEMFEIARSVSPANITQIDVLEERLRAGRGAPRTARTARVAASAAADATTTTVTAAPRTVAPALATGPAPSVSAPAPVIAAAPATSTVAARADTGPSPTMRLSVRGDGRVAQVRRFKENGDWASCLAASTNPRSIEVLYERSWCAYNLDRTGEALAGFTATVQNGAALGGNVPRDARFGMILSYLALNMTEEGARLAAATPLTAQQRLEVETTILDQRGVRAFLNEEYPQAIAYLTALEQLTGSLRRDLSMLRGYAYLNNGQSDLALAEFQRLHAELATDETRAALASVRGIRSGG